MDVESPNPTEMDQRYSQYIIIFSNPNSFGSYADLVYFDQAPTWHQIVEKFINRMNQVCPTHALLHTTENLKKHHDCFHFQYSNLTCGECDSTFCILPIGRISHPLE